MPKDTIKCPKCGELIPISGAIAHEIEEELRLDFEKRKAAWTAESEAREKALLEQFNADRKKIEGRIREEVEDRRRLEFNDLKIQLEEQKSKVRKAEEEELRLRKAARELKERQQKMELEMERKLDDERAALVEKAKKDFEDERLLKEADKNKLISDLRNQIEDLKRKVEQGSQKMAGEVLELELEKVLAEEFPFDEIEAISSGVRGADIIQHVKTQAGRVCGKILWESKRTKTWSDGWIQKLKDDQREAKADAAVIVSEVLPKGMRHFRQIDTVWVADIPTMVSLAIALRTMLIQIARTKDLQTGKEEKMEVVYGYLTGPEFANRVQAIMEGFIGMKNELDTERRSMERLWARREKQIERVILNIAGMRGDLEGIVGKTLPSIRILELPEGEGQENSEESRD